MFLAPFRRSEARHFHVGFQGFTQPFLEVERDRGYKLKMKIPSKKKTLLGDEKKEGVVMASLWTHRKFEVLNNGKYLGTSKSSCRAYLNGLLLPAPNSHITAWFTFVNRGKRKDIARMYCVIR